MKRDKVINYYSNTATPNNISNTIINNVDSDKNLSTGEIAIIFTKSNEGIYTLNQDGDGLIEYKPYEYIKTRIINSEKVNISFKGDTTSLANGGAIISYTDSNGVGVNKTLLYDPLITHYTYNIPVGSVYTVSNKIVNGYTVNGSFKNITAKEFANRNIVIEYVQMPMSTLTFKTLNLNQNVLITYKKECFNKIVINGVNQNITGTGSFNYTFPNIGTQSVDVQLKNDLTSVENLFLGCSNLTNIPSNLFANCTEITNFNAVFSQCTELINIPSNIFSKSVKATSFSETFSACYGIKDEIPENLFINCPLVTNFNNTFSNCNNLSNGIPQKLFSNCPLVTDFQNTFSGCIYISSIPSSLFSNCKNVTNFNGVFQSIYSIMNIPSSLFSNCKNVTNFNDAFFNCKNLTGTTPTTNGLELWQRAGQPGYPSEISGTACFYGCVKMWIYPSIPTNWK